MLGFDRDDSELDVNYRFIKNIILSDITWSPADIEVLKNKFSKEINSRRKLSTITNLFELLSVLEDRCALDYINIELIFVIEGLVNSDKLATAISCHQKLLLRWHNKLPSPVTIFEPELHDSYSSLTVVIPKSVVKVVGNGIGDAWRDFARFLDIIENDIDKIDESSKDTRDKVKRVFKIFEEKASLMNYKDIILKGLWTIRRNDLMDQVDKMFCEFDNGLYKTNTFKWKS